MTATLPFLKHELEESIVARWRRIVQRFSERVAVTMPDGQRFTYRALDEQSDSIAVAIIDRLGVENAPVILFLEHSPHLIVAMIGALKANKAYVALEPMQSAELTNVLTTSATPLLILTTDDHRSTVRTVVGLHPDVLRLEDVHKAAALPDLAISPDALAALFFTSGTAGLPKGVPYSHRMILHRIWIETNTYQLTADDRFSGLRAVGVAASVRDIFNALLNGGTLCLYPLRQYGLTHLSPWLLDQGITYFHLPGMLFREWMQTLPHDARFPAIRYLSPSGRKSGRDCEQIWPHLGADACLISTYATTETSLLCQGRITRQTPVQEGLLSVGQPVPDKLITLVDDHDQPVAAGQVGEVVVRSRYIASGYWQQPELSIQRFVRDNQSGNEIVYRTGDFGRLREDGCLELLSRQDAQVKVRGYRVMLDDVETLLAQVPGVGRAAAKVFPTPDGDNRLVGYVTERNGAGLAVSAIRNRLAGQVAGHMVPAQIVIVPELPLTRTGKIDRHALPQPDKARPRLDTPYVAPSDELEKQIADIWADLLELDEVGIDDNFFELGGDSILAMRMWLQVEQRLGHAVPRAFLRNPTVANIASLLQVNPEPTHDSEQTAGAPANLADAKSPRGRARSRLRRFAKQLEGRILEHPLKMPYPEGMAWLRRWANQPLVQRTRYFRSRRLFQDFAACFDSSVVDDRKAFGEAILNNFWGDHIRQLGRRRSVSEFVAALQSSPWPFWRDLGDQFAASLRNPAGPAPYDIVGLELLHHALEQGRGVVLAAPHLPTPGVYRLIFARYGIYPHALTGTSFDRARAELTSPENPSVQSPPRRVQRTHELLRAWEELKQGNVVFAPIDAAAGVGPRIYTPVGKRLFPFNVGAIELALVTGAPLLPITTLLQPDNRLRLTICEPLNTGSPQMAHDERVWIAAQACGEFLASLWHAAPFARTWGDMAHFLSVTRSTEDASPGQWVDFDDREAPHA